MTVDQGDLVDIPRRGKVAINVDIYRVYHSKYRNSHKFGAKCSLRYLQRNKTFRMTGKQK